MSHKGSTIKAKDKEYYGFRIKTKVVNVESSPNNVMDLTLDKIVIHSKA
jgi:hypothetical protein